MDLLRSIEPAVVAPLRAQAERDLARRIVFGSTVYFAMVVIVAWGGGYYQDHPETILWFGALTFFLGAGRLAAALRTRDETGPGLPRWGQLLRRLTELQLAVWGAFAWWTLQLYGFGHMSLLVLLSTAAFSGGVTSSLSPDLALARRGLLLIILPPTLWGAFQGTREGWVLLVFGVIYLAFLLLQVNEHHSSYWASSISAAKAAASERDRLFRVAFETANAGMALIDGEGHFRRANRRICRMFGRTEDELLTATFQSLLEDPNHQQDWFEALQVGIAACDREEKFVGSEGLPLWGAVSLAAVDAERPQGQRHYLVMIQDVTERKHAEIERNEMEAQLRQVQKLESIGTLAGGVAHDFNNLLLVMMGYADLASEEVRGTPVAEDLAEILKAAERAQTLIEQLLAFSRRQLTQPEILNLNQIVSETHQLLQRTVGNHIQVDVSLDPALKDVEIDAGQIQRVLVNLVLNACDAMPDGGKVSIATRMAELSMMEVSTGLESPRVGLSVSDTGCGMNAETKKRAFEPFFTTKKLGSGLGLASVYGIVKQNGGEIRVESEVGKGTRFEILLPGASRARVSQAADQPVVVPVSGRIPVNCVVLVAEDEPALRKLIRTILESFGHRAVLASDGEEALEIFRKTPARFDLLLTDVVMPGMGGRKLVDQVRQLRPDLAVIYMTAYSASEIAEQGVVEPNIRVLAKPFTTDDLRHMMRRVLGEKSKLAGASR